MTLPMTTIIITPMIIHTEDSVIFIHTETSSVLTNTVFPPSSLKAITTEKTKVRMTVLNS